jgi:hypothetical protein
MMLCVVMAEAYVLNVDAFGLKPMFLFNCTIQSLLRLPGLLDETR